MRDLEAQGDFPTPPTGDGYYEEMGRRWLGLGNIHARHWFLGLEPGGSERPEWPTVWATRFTCAEVIDGRMEAGDPDHERWFSAHAGKQPTWIPLIRTLLAFKGLTSDDTACLRYQRERFVAGDGDEALLELSAYAARDLGVDSPRERYMEERITRIHELLGLHEPAFLVCYGRSRRREYERVVGGLFDDDGFRVSGKTICALVTHPTPRFRRAPPPEFWIALGRRLRERHDELCGGLS